MRQCQAAHDDVDRIIGRRNPCRSPISNAPARARLRACSSISADVSTPILRWPRATRCAAYLPAPQTASSAMPGDSPSRISWTIGFVVRKESIAGAVIRRRVLPISRDRVSVINDHARTVGQQFVAHQPADLRQTILDKLLVVLTGPRLQQRKALKPQPISQRVPIDQVATPDSRQRPFQTLFLALPKARHE